MIIIINENILLIHAQFALSLDFIIMINCGKIKNSWIIFQNYVITKIHINIFAHKKSSHSWIGSSRLVTKILKYFNCFSMNFSWLKSLIKKTPTTKLRKAIIWEINSLHFLYIISNISLDVTHNTRSFSTLTLLSRIFFILHCVYQYVGNVLYY